MQNIVDSDVEASVRAYHAQKALGNTARIHDCTEHYIQAAGSFCKILWCVLELVYGVTLQLIGQYMDWSPFPRSRMVRC